MKTEVSLFLCHGQENDFPSYCIVFLENVLVCAQSFSKLAHGTKVYASSRSHLDFWDTIKISMCMPKLCSRGLNREPWQNGPHKNKKQRAQQENLSKF